MKYFWKKWHRIRNLLLNFFSNEEYRGYLLWGIKWCLGLAHRVAFCGWVNIKDKKDFASKRYKSDILGRADWLSEKIIVEPQQLLDQMPQMLGEHFICEWAIYSCSMFAASLFNISRLYPEEKNLCLSRIKKLIELILSSEIRSYDTKSWNEDALETLSGSNSHMTYLSILAWTITNYKLTGGGNEYDEMLHACCEALCRRMKSSPDLNLRSFPMPIIFIPDMLVAIVALKNYERLYDGKYGDIVDKWLQNAHTIWIDSCSGLLKSMLNVRNNRTCGIRGSYTTLSCYYLTLVDEAFAKQQYEIMKTRLSKSRPLFGIKEFIDKTLKFGFDVDAGPIVFELSPSGTVFAIGAATFFEDYGFRKKLLRTGEIAGQTIGRKNKRHYRLGELALVGEATALAMKTNIK